MVLSQRDPWYSPVRLAQRAVIYAVVAYFTFCTYLYFKQDGMIYPAALSGAVLDPATALHRAKAEGLAAWEDVKPGEPSPAGYVPRNFADPVPRGTIVVFHGNGGWAGERLQYPEAFQYRGFRTFLYEYPGYGGRPGHPGEAAIVPDARALIRQLAAHGLGPIYVWGELLGSGVACAVVADSMLPVQGLVLMMPWDTLAHVATYRFPIVPAGLLMHDRYDSVANLAHFKRPVCIIRGEEDTIIPPALSLALFARLTGPKLMMVEPGYGHGDWPSEPNLGWWDEALNFIASSAAPAK